MNHNFKDSLGNAFQALANISIFIAILIGLLAITTGAVLVITMPINMVACNTWQAVNPQLEIRYDWLVGCMLKTPTGIWLSAENIQYINGELLLQHP